MWSKKLNYSATWAAFLFVSVGLMYFTASQLAYFPNTLVAAGTCISLIAASALRNRPIWDAEMAANPIERYEPLRTASANARFMGFAYGWGSLSMATMYYLTDLYWYHAYQYSIYMAIPAVVSIIFARTLRSSKGSGHTQGNLKLSMYLTVFQALAMIGIVGYLLMSGKLEIIRKDWAADHVFLWGCLAILGLSILALAVQWRLSRYASPITPSSPPVT